MPRKKAISTENLPLAEKPKETIEKKEEQSTPSLENLRICINKEMKQKLPKPPFNPRG